MKNVMKKVLSFAMILAMVLGMTTAAFAAEPKLDSSISVTGLSTGDSVGFYQVLKYAPDSEKNDSNNKTGWELTDAFKSTNSDPDEAKAEDWALVSALTDGSISADDALAVVAKAFNASATATVAASSGKAEYAVDTTAKAGLYVAFVTPASTDKVTLYNPVFVSADFDEQDPASNVIDISSATGTYNNGESKKQIPEVVKEMDNSTDKSVQVGDVVPFTVKTTIPAYATYKAPKFTVTDTLSTGLIIDPDTDITLVAPAGLTAGDDYKLTPSENGFTLEFTEEYLLTLTQSVYVEITYSGKVTHDAPANVNLMTNTAEIKYSNNPLDTEGKGTDEKKTYHYTFTIDGNINGTETLETDEQYINKEVVKTAVDAAGNPITEEVNSYTTPGESSSTTTEAVPLGECTFELTAAEGSKLPNDAEKLTTNSTSTGLIVFKGLDEGTYTLKETAAPAGYVIDPDEHTVVISAVYNADGTLSTYTITIDGAANTFTAQTNTKTGEVKTVWKSGDTTVLTSLIQNVKAKQLPATGGVGTRIFYIAGSVLLVGAAVLLITKKRMSSM